MCHQLLSFEHVFLSFFLFVCLSSVYSKNISASRPAGSPLVNQERNTLCDCTLTMNFNQETWQFYLSYDSQFVDDQFKLMNLWVFECFMHTFVNILLLLFSHDRERFHWNHSLISVCNLVVYYFYDLKNDFDESWLNALMTTTHKYKYKQSYTQTGTCRFVHQIYFNWAQFFFGWQIFYCFEYLKAYMLLLLLFLTAHFSCIYVQAMGSTLTTNKNIK